MARFTIDRFEGQWAVLETPNGKTINYPRNLLPKDAKEGDVFDLNIDMNQEATGERKTNIKGIIVDLKKKDEGGIYNYKEVSIPVDNSDLDSVSVPKPSPGKYPSGLLFRCRPGRFDGDHSFQR